MARPAVGSGEGEFCRCNEPGGAEHEGDKSFSVTDCSSFVVMKERRIKAALTNDRHFVQAGFQTYP